MIKELKIAIDKAQSISIHLISGETLIGTPEKTQMNAKIKLRNEQGITYVPYEDLIHVTRIINFP